MVLVSPARPSTAAVSTIVSVPWVMTMRSSGGPAAGLEDLQAVGGLHVEAVDELVELHLDGDRAADELQDLGEVGVLERQVAADLVVVLVEGAAGDDDPDRHDEESWAIRALCKSAAVPCAVVRAVPWHCPATVSRGISAATLAALAAELGRRDEMRAGLDDSLAYLEVQLVAARRPEAEDVELGHDGAPLPLDHLAESE